MAHQIAYILILQKDHEGNIVGRFESVAQASAETGIVLTNIAAAVRGRRGTAGGSVWEEANIGSLVRKRLFFDIETSPNIGMFWSAGWKQTIDYSNIIKERAIICICYKWEDEKNVHYLTWDKNQNDKAMLEAFIPISNEADEMVGHNGDKFDLAWIRTRCLFHRIPMFPKYLSIDTLKIARSKFRFNSNRLNYIAQFLGLGQKIHTEFSLWKEILLNNNEEAMTTMVKYCKEDVRLLERIYAELKNHIEPKQNYGMLYESNKQACPECGGEDLKVVSTKTTPAGTLKRQYLCRGCGKHHHKTSRGG